MRTAKPTPTRYDIRDGALKGFHLRVYPTGRKIYFAEFGRGKRLKIGDAELLTPTQAREEAKAILGDAAKGIDPRTSRRAKKGHTLDAYLTDEYGPWLEANRKRGAGEIARIRSRFPELVDRELSEITSWLVEKWRARRLKAGISKNTVNRDIAPLKAAMTKASEWKLVEGLPLREVKPSKIDSKAIVRYLTEDEEKRLRRALDAREERLAARRVNHSQWRQERGGVELETFSGDYLKPMVLVSMNTGLRQGELFALTWTDIDFERAMLTIRGTTAKSGQTRHLPLNAEALDVVHGWRRVQPAPGLVFTGRGGTAFDNVRRSWATVLTAAEITGFRWHDLRHHFASRLVMAGVDLNTVRELLGHADIKMTLRYSHLAPEHKAEAVARLVGR